MLCKDALNFCLIGALRQCTDEKGATLIIFCGRFTHIYFIFILIILNLLLGALFIFVLNIAVIFLMVILDNQTDPDYIFRV